MYGYPWSRTIQKKNATRNQGRKKYAALVSVPEQLMIRWITSVQDNDYISGISAMNDLLAQYPRDKHLNYAAGRWLLQRQQYQNAQKAVERALAVDPAYPPALNVLGYAYARTGQFAKAFAAMEKYTAVLPNEANPQDSYAEVFEIAGDFERAVKHYQAALRIDPKFYPSQGGLADTYSLMGRQEAARAEFAKAVEMSPNEAAKTDYRLRLALTYVREKKFVDADKACTEAATLAHASGLWVWEARAHRTVAMYQPDLGLASKHLDQAEAVLQKRLGTADASFTEEFVKNSSCPRGSLRRGPQPGPGAGYAGQTEANGQGRFQHRPADLSCSYRRLFAGGKEICRGDSSFGRRFF